MDNPSKGIFIGNRVWHDMYDFKNNCILLVLASDKFKETDYIRDYDNFLNYIQRINDFSK